MLNAGHCGWLSPEHARLAPSSRPPAAAAAARARAAGHAGSARSSSTRQVVNAGNRLADRDAVCAPAVANQLVLAQELFAFLAADRRIQRHARRAAGTAGLRRRTDAGVRRRSGCRNGVWRIGSRSNRPEIDRPPREQVGRQVGADRGQRQVSSNAARWPPAECPATMMRRGLPPYSAACRQVQASACTICSAIASIVTVGRERVVRDHDHRAFARERRTDERDVALVERAPVAAVDEEEHRRIVARGRKHVERLGRRAARRRCRGDATTARARSMRRATSVRRVCGCSGMRARLLYWASSQAGSRRGMRGAPDKASMMPEADGAQSGVTASRIAAPATRPRRQPPIC